MALSPGSYQDSLGSTAVLMFKCSVSDSQSKPSTLVFFDGHCNFCSETVAFMLRRRALDYYRFVSIQSTTGSRLLRDRGIDPESLQSFVILKHGLLFTKSAAVFEIVRDLGGLWRLLIPLSCLPTTFCDWLYSVVARNRYRWFGVREQCHIPDVSQRTRFLE